MIKLEAAIIGLVTLASCAWFKANAPAIEADLKTACTVAEAVDPSLSTVVCAVINAAEEIISTQTIVCPTPEAAATMANALPASTTLAPILKKRAAVIGARTYGQPVKR